MTDYSIKEYIRLISGIQMPQTNREQIEEYLVKNADVKKEISGKYIAVASFAAALAIGAIYAVKGSKDKFNVR